MKKSNVGDIIAKAVLIGSVSWVVESAALCSEQVT